MNLLVFDRWSSQIDPTIPFRISKWIFAACILFSWVLCFYEWIRAIRVIRRRNVAESYLDPLAVTLQSIRVDKNGRGWKRFLVFAELTKSKKGADYVALFVYFQFKGAVRILLAEGPRQVVNGLTLYGVMKANLIPVGQNAASDGHSSFVQFFVNVQILANEHTEQAVILFSMLFTFIIWVISALSFLIACALYGGFLWHYIPSTDRTLSRYCRRKIDKRLGRIVNSKFRAAISKQDAQRRRERGMLEEDGGNQRFQRPTRKPTLPALPNKSPVFPAVDKPVPTVTVELMPPPYSYRPTRQERLAAQQPHLLTYGHELGRPGYPTRTDSQSTKISTSSTDSDSHLISQAATMGTSATMRDRVTNFADELDLKDYDVYDMAPAGHGYSERTTEPARPLPYGRGVSQPIYTNNNVMRKPIRSDSAPGVHSTSDYIQDSAVAPPARAMTTGGQDGISRGQGHSVRFGAITQVPPARNFSLPHRKTIPVTDSSAPNTLPNLGEAYEMRPQPAPVSIYRTFPPFDRQQPNDELPYIRSISTEIRAPPTQTRQPPRRNMTMPMEEAERYPPPRRVGTEPLPSRARVDMVGGEVDMRVRGDGDRGPIPVIRGMTAQAPRREGNGYGYITKKVYRFS